jgi:cell division protein FtsN
MHACTMLTGIGAEPPLRSAHCSIAPQGTPPAAPSASSGAAAPNVARESTATAPSATASRAAEPCEESSYAIPLAIKVCSFTGKASAEAMVAALAALGYRASLGHSSGAGGRTWYVVKLGPYKEWNTASNVAARVAIA